MQFALYNSKKHSAQPALKGTCLHCGNEVIAKCGAKNIWHWAHVKSGDCDAWSEPETQWHRDWKDKFGTEYSEIRIIKNNVYHIADVLNNTGIVFEFQNSAISSEIIKAREEFYGSKMIWLINGISFKDNFVIYEEDFIKSWKVTILNEFDATRYPQFRNALIIEDWQVRSDPVKRFLKNKGFDYSPDFKLYFLDLYKNKYANREQLILKIEEEILDLYLKHHHTTSTRVEFVWEHFRRSWQEAQRPVFIDFGDDILLHVTAGIGKKYGRGNKILKTKFLEKYCKTV